MMQKPNSAGKNHIFGTAVSRMRGTTLLSLLISTAVSIPIVGGVLIFYVNTLESAAYMNAVSRVQENGRFAVDHIARTLRMTRYDDPYTPLVVPTEISGTSSSATSLSMTGFTLKTDTDVISISHEGAPQVRDCQGMAVTSGNLVTNTYAVSADDELICRTAVDPVVIAEGVEDMQILYGIDSDADSVADRYMLVGNVVDWSQVVSIRVSLLINSVEAVYATSIHGCESCSTFNPLASNLLRAEFHTTIRLRNL